MPELKRVIAAYGDRVVMEETLPAALAALFKEFVPAAPCQCAPGSRPQVPWTSEPAGHWGIMIGQLIA